ncbi:MAG: CHAT domain-containing protein [Bacteroidota bacterium]
MGKPPFILLAFANDQKGKLLRSIAEEQRAIQKAMEALVAQGKVRLEILPNATPSDIFEAFRKYRGQIRVFHYGGHANDLRLVLSDAGGKFGINGFASFLSQQKGLELVFMNACATAAQEKPLAEAGIPRLILTQSNIQDSVALNFARHFYLSLASGQTIGQSFQEAEGATLSEKGGHTRSLFWDEEEPAPDSFPWIYHETANVKPYQLPLRRFPLRMLIGIALAAVLLFAAGQFWQWQSGQPFVYQVKVNGMPEDTAILRGELLLQAAQESFKAELDEGYHARFLLDGALKGEKASIRFVHGQPYQVPGGDTLVELTEGQMLDLPVILPGLDIIQGFVYDFDSEMPLKGVQVKILTNETQTDNLGRFYLHLSKVDQRKFQYISFTAPAYKTQILPDFPVYFQKEIRIRMEKISR